MRDYKSAVADILGALMSEATTAGESDVGSLACVLRDLSRTLDTQRETMTTNVELHCPYCNRDWSLAVTVKREREGMPSNCPACFNAGMTPEYQARRGPSGHTARAVYADGSTAQPAHAPQSIWIRCDAGGFNGEPPVTTRTWIRKVDGVPVEAVSLDTDTGAIAALARYWGDNLQIGEWRHTDTLSATTVPNEKAPPIPTVRGLRMGVTGYRVAPLSLRGES